MMKTLAALTLYVGFVWVFLVTICTAPAHAFQATQYARVVAQAERIAYVAAHKADLAAKVATAAVVESPGSLAVRLVTGPVGWAALGVTVGLAVASMYYSASDLQAIKQAATPPGGASGSNPTFTTQTYGIGTNGSCSATLAGSGTKTCVAGYDQVAVIGVGSGCFTGWGNTASWEMYGTTGSGSSVACWVGHKTGQSGGLVANPGGTPTQPQIQTYVQGLPDSDPQSVPSHTAPNGVGQAVPAGNTTESVPVSPTDMPSTVKQKPVPSGDSLIADNVPPPQGTEQAQQQTAASTKTETQNPDGSTTTEETGTFQCTTPDHEARTFASVLQAHQQTWTTSGLLGAVTLLKSLVWPTTLPTISLPSQFFGAQSVNFNDWAWFFTALRTMVIAIATLASYRIIFVGGR